MARSDKQSQVVQYLATVETATLSEIYQNVAFGYHNNWAKHLGGLLSRMVDNQMIERVKPGVFRLNQRAKMLLAENQQTLF